MQCVEFSRTRKLDKQSIKGENLQTLQDLLWMKHMSTILMTYQKNSNQARMALHNNS